MSYPAEDWLRLGRMLIAQRVALNPEWHNRQKFVNASGLNERLVSDLEKGRRAAYRDSTLDAVENAYHLPQGAIQKALADPEYQFPEVEPAGRTFVGPVAARLDREHEDVFIPDEVPYEDLPAWEQAIWSAPQLSPEERQAAIYFLQLARGELAGEGDTLAALFATLQAIIPQGDAKSTPDRRR